MGEDHTSRQREFFGWAALAMTTISCRATIAQLPNGALKSALLEEWQLWRALIEERIPYEASQLPEDP